MNYEEREKTLCNNCEAKENCSYISRNLESKCSFIETTMYGWELGYRDAIDKACKIIDAYLDMVRKDIAYTNKEFIKDFKQAMEEQQ